MATKNPQEAPKSAEDAAKAEPFALAQAAAEAAGSKAVMIIPPAQAGASPALRVDH